MDPKVQLVIEATGCTADEARLALDSAGGNVEDAARFVHLITRDILAIKITFEGRRIIKINGFVYIVGDIRTGKVFTVEAGVAYKQDIVSGINANMGWRVFGGAVQYLGDQPGIHHNATLDLKKHLAFTLQPWKMEELGQLYREKRMEEIQKKFEDEITRGVGEDVYVSLGIESLTRVQIQETDPGKDVAQADQAAREDEAEEHKVLAFLRCELVVAPVNGLRATQLLPGMPVAVRIIDDSEIGQYLARLLGAPAQPDGAPLVAPVERVERLDSGRFRVEVRFGPGIVGHAVVDGEVRVKTGNLPQGRVPPATTAVDGSFLLLAGAALLLGIAALIIRRFI